MYIRITNTKTVACYKREQSSFIEDFHDKWYWLQQKSGSESLKGSVPRLTDWHSANVDYLHSEGVSFEFQLVVVFHENYENFYISSTDMI
jgi:hypothetical protein